ncbi:MAG: PSD1 domain-containing protein [Bryobacterales bacterium]|nr:PSD1 domain-containing protein [Bryobacterales bacterium]
MMRALWLIGFTAAWLSGETVEQGARRVLTANCLGCHGASAMGGLDMRARDGLSKVVVPGKAGESLLYQAVRREGKLQMPPGKKALAAEDVKTLRAWIDAGARWEGTEGGGAWWSFRRLPRAQAPSANAAEQIDAFVMAKLREKGLRPVSPADKRTLIRRLSFDLHGLPPTAEEVARFLKDDRTSAWEDLVDRMLDSPRYGERWGRHWLDVVRYADTGGFETDIYFPNAWRYRDYVIQAFQTDKPYNRFVQEQVAGDEMWPDNLDLDGDFEVPAKKQEHLAARIATGMYTIGPAYHEAALFGGQVRYEWLTDVVDTTGEAFLGLTLGCSRCHNHKFDPLTQRDYHAMMAVFAASEEREVPVMSQFSIFGFKSGYPNWLKVEELKAAIGRIDRGARQRVVNGVRRRFPKDVLAAYDVPSAKRTPEQRALAAQVEKAMTEAGLQENAEGKDADIPYTAEESKRRAELVVELGQAALKANPVLPTATILGPAAVVPEVRMTYRGDWRSVGEKVDAAFPAALSGGATVPGTNRRKALAEWLTAADHPLTARVMVNRVWHWHFGRGIVATPNDFGRQGEEPTHPELLDWLASEFVAQGWSVKKLHRWILLSETYRRGSTADEGNLQVDANNRYLWRFNRQRLDAETLRDSMLAVSGELNLKMGGRPVIPTLSKEEYSTLWSRSQWPEALEPTEQNRRSVYLYSKRTFPLPMLSTFDAPDTSVSCSRRDSTTVAPQALTLINGEFSMRQAEAMAERLREQEDAVGAAWRAAFGRAPSSVERSKADAVVGKDDGGLARLCLVLFNMNEFLYVD